ncbi:phage antirepressor KilAC domain-containing protein [Clostridia bacterium]|nr:phage antirepressor KilAC domain-containing protein [Clostridia bacterium]
MNELTIFNYGDKTVRTVKIDGEPWWVLKDVCEVFGDTDHKRVKQRLDVDEVGGAKVPHPQNPEKFIEISVVSESGLYSALFAMQPEKARGVSDEYIAERQAQLKKFRRWVTHEVLPSIRKHGMYAADELLANPDLLIAALNSLKAERERNATLVTTVSVQNQQISEMSPKASYYDLILQCKGVIPTTTIAKDYGKSAIWFNGKLHELRVQFKVGKTWVLYQKHAEMGYTQTKTHEYVNSQGQPDSKVHTYWTQKGRLFLYGLLKENGVYPLIERNQSAAADFTEVSV